MCFYVGGWLIPSLCHLHGLPRIENPNTLLGVPKTILLCVGGWPERASADLEDGDAALRHRHGEQPSLRRVQSRAHEGRD